ncbi:hypothetical protein [Chromobacterium piscinae]|uniref:hypothetical protein n=1 Tax=Chromobacterium piscinae TaxID=686831 RepID=UPI00320B3EA9
MQTTTDFDEWLDAADPCDAANVAGLVHAVERECDFSGFKAERAKNGKLIVTASRLDLALLLTTKTAEEAFVRRIHGRYVPGHLDAGIWAAVEHHNERD